MVYSINCSMVFSIACFMVYFKVYSIVYSMVYLWYFQWYILLLSLCYIIWFIVCFFQYEKRMEAERIRQEEETRLRKKMNEKKAKQEAERLHQVRFYTSLPMF